MLTIEAKRAARAAAGAWASANVVVVAGRQAPRLVGRGYYWTTLSGKTEVRYPSAYGWRTLYWPSTRRVEVGAAWLARRGLLSHVSATDPTILVSPVPAAA